ncbi:serine/threonine protein kinase, partial [Micromonospora sp. CPCC 205561]
PTAAADPGGAGGPVTGAAEPDGGESRSARRARERRRRPVPRPVLIVPVVLLVGVALVVPAIRQEETTPPRSLPTTGPADPTPSPTPAAVASPPAATPRASAPPVTPQPTPTAPRPGDLIEAANRLDGLIGTGLDDGGIRADVGLDLRNELRNLTAAARTRAADLGERIDRLREKVATRRGEGAISGAYARRLDSAITALETARL